MSTRLKKKEIQKKQLYELTELVNVQTKQVNYCMYEFDTAKMKQLRAENSIKNNSVIFSKKYCKELVPGSNINFINRVKQSDLSYQLIFDPFKSRLDLQLKKSKGMNEDESIYFMKNIVAAIFSLHSERYACYNVRAENFVLVETPNQKNLPINQRKIQVKICSVPFKTKRTNGVAQQIDSPFTWKRQYQSPQCYEKQLSLEELNQSLVWNIGCIWLHLLHGQHTLNSLQKITKFCIGNPTEGKFNYNVLNLENKLSNENNELLKKLLAYDPSKRMTLKEVFRHKVLGYYINSFFEKENQSMHFDYESFVSEDLTPIKASDQTTQINLNSYKSLTDFIANLISIIKRNNFLVLAQEKPAIQEILKGVDWLIDDQSQKYSPKNIKKLNLFGEKSYTTITAKDLQSFIRPYKFYYDKTVFMANCLSKLKIQLKQKQRRRYKNNSLDPQKLVMDQPQDLIFTFEFAIIYMRLIYLKNLHKSIEIYQNIFNIPRCVYDIKNSKFDDSSHQWQMFQETAIYTALGQFLQQEYKKCEEQFENLIKNQSSYSQKRLSNKCEAKIQLICEKMPYKSCPVEQFLGEYKKVLRQVILKVDHDSLVQKGLKVPMDTDSRRKRQNMINVGLLQIAIFIQSPMLFNPTQRQKIFNRFMRNMLKESNQDFIMMEDKSIVSKYSPADSFIDLSSKQYFAFDAYENFLKNADYQIVKKHVQFLVTHFRV